LRSESSVLDGAENSGRAVSSGGHASIVFVMSEHV
jgi:hypothetical protein